MGLWRGKVPHSLLGGQRAARIAALVFSLNFSYKNRLTMLPTMHIIVL